MRVALLCIVAARGSALFGKKKLAGPTIKVAATLAVDKKTISKADVLFKKRTAASCDAAAKLYEAELKRTGYADADVLLKAADALNTAMRIRTNSNTITIDGTVDTPANKAVWKKDGPRAFDLAAKGLKASSKVDARALGIRFDAYMFSCSYNGLVKQALTGSGTAYKKMGEEMAAKHPRYDGDVGSAVLACFYHVAPWPVGSPKKAIANARKAVSRGGPTARNLYYVAVISHGQKDYKTAVDYFKRALNAKPGSPSETDFAAFVRSESRRGLAKAEEALEKAAWRD